MYNLSCTAPTEHVCSPTVIMSKSLGHIARTISHVTLEKDILGRPFVTFSYDDEELLPDPQLLDLHAVCARVAHMSGAAEALNKLERDIEDTVDLASDGSSASLLDHVLSPSATVA